MLRRSNWQYSLAFIILAVAFAIIFSSISIAASSNSSNFVANYETSWMGGIVNSSNFNGSISGGILAGDSNSTNYSVTLGIGAGSVEPTTTTTTPATTSSTTTTTIPDTVFSILVFTALDNKVSSIIVASGATVSISNFKNIPLSALNFKTNKSLSGAAVLVKKLAETEITIPRPPEKNYDFIEITKTNIAEDAVSSAKIKFTITKAWMTENSVTEERVVLQRYEGTGWRKLPTKKISSDATTITYESDSPGLSIFAISGLAPGETPPATMPGMPTTTTIAPEATTTSTAAPTTTTTAQQEIVIPIGGGEGFKIPIGLALAAGIIIIVIAAVLLRKKPQ